MSDMSFFSFFFIKFVTV